MGQIRRLQPNKVITYRDELKPAQGSVYVICQGSESEEHSTTSTGFFWDFAARALAAAAFCAFVDGMG